MDFLKQAAEVASKVTADQAAPAAAAPAAPAAEAPAAAAAPAAGAAPAAAAAPAPAAGAPVDIKATLLEAVNEFKAGDYKGAVEDVMKTGLVQKLAASQAAKPAGEGSAAGGQADLMSSLGGLVSGLGKQ